VTAERRDWFPGLDAVRALGAACVVGTHVGFYTGRTLHGPFAGTIARLDAGVALFFVLTGFLLFRPYVVAAQHHRPRPATGSYLRRRALRILPAYWIVVLVCTATLPPLGATSRLSDLLHHLTLRQIYGLGVQHTGLTQAWSLCVELSFYLLLPWLARLVLLRRGPVWTYGVLGALAVFGAAWTPFLTATNALDVRIAGQWLPGFLDWFVAGMLLALVQVSGRSAPSWTRRLHDVARSPGTCWAAALAVFAVATSPLAGPASIRGGTDAPTPSSVLLKNLLYLVAAALVALPLVLGPQDEGVVRRRLSGRTGRFLGEVSYGVFLWHLAVLEGYTRVRHQQLFTGSWVVTFLLVWGLTLPVAWASYRFVERPLMSRRPRRPVVVPVQRVSVDHTTTSPVAQSA
jgi:peptidoglycan/LPS O-acetylase OafA/YrhL